MNLFLLAPCLSYERIYFIHIPKCGGTTVRDLLARTYSRKKCHFKRIHPDSDWLNRADLKLFAAHNRVQRLEEMGANLEEAFVFTVLREPVERVISDAQYCSQRDDKYISPLETKANKMCWYLASKPNLKGEALLENCIENLKKFNHIIFLDDSSNFEEGVSKLFTKLGKKCPVKRISVINKRKKTFPISEETKDKIRELNSLDIALFEYAKKYFFYSKP